MRSPSVAGVATAGLLREWTFSISLTGAARHQAIVPRCRSIQSVSSLLVVGLKLVKKTRSPQMHGDEWPWGRPGFQSRFLAGPNSVGSFMPSAATPAAVGPRNGGQRSPARTSWVGPAVSAAVKQTDAIAVSSNAEPIIAENLPNRTGGLR